MQTTSPVDHPEYNATAIDIRFVHDDLMILRVEPDVALPDFDAGQYTTLGLLTDERRVGEAERTEESGHRLIRRVYSIGSPMVEDGSLWELTNARFLEFYIALVRRDSDNPPSLTPRLFAMEVGDRLFMGLKPKGTYTLHPVESNDDVIFLATGTGEAPHNALLNELLIRQHKGRIASFVCVRNKRDLAYISTHRLLEKSHANYRYVSLTTREPENVDIQHPHFVGKQYLQDVFLPHNLPRYLDWTPDPATTHAFLCGNPAMIGAPKRDPEGAIAFPDPKGMIETLTELGFRVDQPREQGNIHFERYW